MPKMIQARNVPDDVHTTLAERLDLTLVTLDTRLAQTLGTRARVDLIA